MGKTVPLSEITFVVVDIETTGSIPSQHAITEIGAVKVRGGRILERFETLVNPEQAIPPFIQRLTGIKPAMVTDAPTIDAVLPAFCDFLGESVFVAHHVSFDFRFLSAVSQARLGRPLENEQVCTCRLARKLLPDMRKQNLGALAKHFEIPIEQRHRAMGDAEATAHILIEFLAMLEADGVTTLAKLLAYQKRGGVQYGSMTVPFPVERLATCSQQPGVYLMRNEKGELLYIGKAKNLRKRLRSYFTNLRRQPPKVQEMMQQVFDIETRLLGSELEALLEEAHLIKRHQPYYNRQIKNFRAFPFLKVTVQDPVPRLQVTSDIAGDGALYFGPYQRKRYLGTLVESMARVFQLRACSDSVFQKHYKLGSPCMAYELATCSGPCARKIPLEEYHVQVREVVAFLEGRGSELTERMTALRDRYSEEMAFEKAKLTHDRLLELLKLQANTQFLAQAVHQNNILVALPDRDPPRTLLLYIYKGRPLLRQVFDPRTDGPEAVLERVAMIQRMLAAQSDEAHELIQQHELEEIRIIVHWLRYLQPEDPVARLWRLTDPYPKLEREIRAFLAAGPLVVP